MSIYQPPKKSIWEEFLDGADDAGVLILIFVSVVMFVMHVENCLDFDDATYDRIILEGRRPSYLNSDCMGFFMRSEDGYD